MFGKDALVGYAGTMGMTFAMEGLNSAILGEGTITGYDAQTNQNLWSYRNFESMDVNNIKSITRLAGGALKAGMEYGFTGQTTLNVLQIGGTGVMEMRLGGNRPMFGIGMNGIDASIGTFASAIQGFRDIGKNNQIVEATKKNVILGNASEQEKAAKLRMQYSFGDAKDRLQLDNILAGRDTMMIGSDVPAGIPDNTRGKTVLNGENGRLIYAKSSNSSDLNTWLAEGTTLQHEAYRDGNQGTEAEQKAETLRATTAHTEMALRMANAFGGNFIIGDANLSNDVGKYLMAARGIGKFSDYVNETYDSSADYWKVQKLNGRLIASWDGSNDITIVNDDGSEKKIATGYGTDQLWRGGFINALFGPGKEDQYFGTVTDMFKNAGMIEMNDEWKTFSTSGGFSTSDVKAGDLSFDITDMALKGGLRQEIQDAFKTENNTGTAFLNSIMNTAVNATKWLGTDPVGKTLTNMIPGVNLFTTALSLLEQPQNDKLLKQSIVDFIPNAVNPIYPMDIRKKVNELMTGAPDTYYNDHSCATTSDELARQMKWKSYFDLTGQKGGVFGSPAEKIKWLKENPDKGVFLGAYNFGVDKNGQLTLTQFEKSGISAIDQDNWKAFELIQSMVKNGQVVLGITPDFKFVKGRFSPAYDVAHIGVFVNGEGNLRNFGGWVTGGGYSVKNWTEWCTGRNTQGYFDARGTYGWKKDQRPFYVYGLYQ
jgi:hypothetical protein